MYFQFTSLAKFMSTAFNHTRFPFNNLAEGVPHTYCQHSISQILISFNKILPSHSGTTSQSQTVQGKIIIGFTYPFFLSASTDISSEVNINRRQFPKIALHVLTNCVLVLTGNYPVKSEYPVQWTECPLTNECLNHNICIRYHFLLNRIQPYTIIFWIEMIRTNGTDDPNVVGQAEKRSISNLLNNTRT